MPTTTMNQIASSYQDSLEELEERDDFETLLDTLNELFNLGERIIERTKWMEKFERDNHLIY